MSGLDPRGSGPSPTARPTGRDPEDEPGTGSERVCVICHRPVGDRAIALRYELRVYSFDREACKLVFQENPDRYLDAGGEVLPEPRD